AVVKKGERFNQGALLGYVGSTGYSTGPHLHWEISNQPPLSNGEFTNREDIVKWLNSHPIKKTSTQISSQSSSSIPLVPIASAITKGNQQTQIASSYRQNSVSTITPERTGQQIVIVDDRSSYVAQQITSNNNEYSYTEINEYSLLNSFIKNKFLLDLNYV
ncbi:MAG: M23 family metallopeptidase, partial [Minisyncoccia bacterium]